MLYLLTNKQRPKVMDWFPQSHTEVALFICFLQQRQGIYSLNRLNFSLCFWGCMRLDFLKESRRVYKVSVIGDEGVLQIRIYAGSLDFSSRSWWLSCELSVDQDGLMHWQCCQLKICFMCHFSATLNLCSILCLQSELSEKNLLSFCIWCQRRRECWELNGFWECLLVFRNPRPVGIIARQVQWILGWAKQ